MDRQKIILIFVGAWISAALLTWFLYATTKAPRSEKMVAITAAARDMPAGTRLQNADLKTVRVPEKDVPKAAILDQKMAIDRPLLFPVGANEAIISNKVASAAGPEGLPALIEIGKRAVSVPITDGSGVAGMIQPRAHVDVLFTKPGSVAEAVTTTILEDIVVLAMGRVTEVQNTSLPNPAGGVATTAARPQTQAATLLVTPEQAQKLELAKNQGKISLALRNPLDHGAVKDRNATTSTALWSEFRPKPQTPDLRNDKLWSQLTARPAEKPAPPKPRSVIDVYRGDKHVQEIFQ